MSAASRQETSFTRIHSQLTSLGYHRWVWLRGVACFSSLFPLQADYRMDGKVELICCSVDGEVRGYLPPTMAGGHAAGGGDEDHGALEELYRRKRVRGRERSEGEGRGDREREGRGGGGEGREGGEGRVEREGRGGEEREGGEGGRG